MDLHYLGLIEIGERIRQQRNSSEEVVRLLLDRIERLDGSLKSFTLVLADGAIAAARQADAEIRSGFHRGPLHGVPVGLKDLLLVKGAPTTCGTDILRNWVPDHESTVAARLRRAGAVVIGKLHMTEAATMEHHPSYPTPVNPWRSDAWTGVSSSGCGVAVAAGLCYGALGTDTGGSIRMPSACCGVTGLKPTWGRVSRYGCFPLAETFDHIGPMARSAADAAAMLQAIAGYDPDDPSTLTAPVPDYRAGQGIGGITVGVDWDHVRDDVAPAVAQSVQAAAEVLSGLGARLRDVIMPVASAGEALDAAMLAEVAVAHRDYFPRYADRYGRRLRQMLEAASEISGVTVAAANIARRYFEARMRALFDEVDLLLIPTLPMTTPRGDAIGAALDNLDRTTRFTKPFNLSGNPTITLPCGFAEDGLPLSLQLVAAHLGEALLCRAGHSFQTATGYHSSRPPIG